MLAVMIIVRDFNSTHEACDNIYFVYVFCCVIIIIKTVWKGMIFHSFLLKI